MMYVAQSHLNYSQAGLQSILHLNIGEKGSIYIKRPLPQLLSYALETNYEYISFVRTRQLRRSFLENLRQVH